MSTIIVVKEGSELVMGTDSRYMNAAKTRIVSRPLVTGFITLRAKTELGLNPMDTAQGLTVLKQELQGMGRN